MDFYQILGSVAGVLGVVVSVPQVIRLYQLKQSKDVSLLMFLLLAIVQLLWTIYGLHLKDQTIVLANSFALLVTFANIVMIIVYRNGQNSN